MSSPSWMVINEFDSFRFDAHHYVARHRSARAGCDVENLEPNRRKCEPLLKHGAVLIENLDGAAKGCQAVITVLRKDLQLFGREAALAGVNAEALAGLVEFLTLAEGTPLDAGDHSALQALTADLAKDHCGLAGLEVHSDR